MPFQEPDLPAVERAVIDLLVEQEVAALATLSQDGYPSASAMHIAADRFTVYVNTFIHHRKYAEMLADPRVSYVASHLPSGGFSDRRQIRSVQVRGRAALVTEPAELARAVEVSREQFPWLRDTGMYNHVTVPSEQPRQVFFRIDQVEAVWADHRVHPLWRVILTFTADGRQVARMRPYPKPVAAALRA
ncbi:MAG TPA: pyridoxamine 5'-phosphate oxidase family protein [Mycobacteriales bacterium]|nr:pyridoxamine 5'-phosphate oxidase family protein [Mycobacteriales bacterium]